MKDVIDLKKLDFSYGDIAVFKDFELNVTSGEWLSIIGPNGSGKSTLLKIIVGLERAEGIVQIDGFILNSENIMEIRRQVGVVFSNPDNTFVAETVTDELAFPLENLQYNKEEIKEKIDEISEKLKITDLLESEPHRLSGGEKQLVALGVALITNPKIIILDEALCMLDEYNKNIIIEHLKKINNEGITIINITHDMEETIYGSRILLINNGKTVIDGNTIDVYKEEKILNRLGFGLPFMIDLSSKLKFYGLVDDYYFDMKDMVNKLWK